MCACLNLCWAPAHSLPHQAEGMTSTGRAAGQPSQRPSRLWGTEQSSGPGETTPEEAPSQGIQKSGTTFPPRTPIKTGASFLVPIPKRGLSLKAGPYHPGLFSGEELGIKTDHGGRSGEPTLKTPSPVPTGGFISPVPGPTLSLGRNPRGWGSGKEHDN